jgi:hypothetical protein
VAAVTREPEDTFLFVAVATVAGLFLIQVARAFNVDSWLALVAGRQVWQSGIPHHDTLAVMTHGHPWIDQQWLSQVVMYALYRVGGLGLLGLVNVTLIVAGLAGSFVAARRLGARPRTISLLVPVCVWLMLPSTEVRTEAFAFPLFVASVYLLACDSRNPSARVYWCLPLLVLWANLHGSASLGAGLVALRGLTLVWERRAAIRDDLRTWRRPLALIVGGPLCLLLTPYGTSIVSYYHATLFNGALKGAVTEWQPVTSVVVIAVPLFGLLGVALWSFGRHRHKTTLWEQAALVALAVAAIDAVRNVPFFVLAAVIIVGLSLDGAVAARFAAPSRVWPRVNRKLAVWTLAVLLALGAAVTVARPAAGFESARLQRVLAVVQAATGANHSLRVMADQEAADWLLWRDPSLRGRVAFDVRFELLSATTFKQLQRLGLAAGLGWKQAARGYRLLVLDVAQQRLSIGAFLAEPGRRILYDDGQFVVILRTVEASR